MNIFRCEDSLESIFTAIYETYEYKCRADETELVLHTEPLLFATEYHVTPSTEKTLKVMNTLQKRFGMHDYYTLCYAMSSMDTDKAQAIYRVIAEGLRGNIYPDHLFDNLADEYVNKTFKLAQNASREEHHLMGFVRFQELDNGILYSEIGPKNNLVTFLMPHFADRLPMENFMIYDSLRSILAIHPAGKQWVVVNGQELHREEFHYSAAESYYSELFRCFCKDIAIKERENYALQRNMLPLRFRKYMIEF